MVHALDPLPHVYSASTSSAQVNTAAGPIWETVRLAGEKLPPENTPVVLAVRLSFMTETREELFVTTVATTEIQY